MIQEIDKYTAEDLWVWQTLFNRQIKLLQDYACKDYLECMHDMSAVLNGKEIPNVLKINEWFKDKTGWEVEVVPGLIPIDEFFSLLSQKRFCSSTWLRSKDSLDYLEEPDMFHDIFGHVPLLAHPLFSEFIEEFGKLGVKYIENQDILIQLKRLYWFTIEFGLIRENNALKVYGAGILSSFGETKVSVSSQVKQLPFNIEQILQKDFRTDIMQGEYFVIESVEQLFSSMDKVKEILASQAGF